MKNFRYEPMLLLPRQAEELGEGEGVVNLGLAPLDEVIDILRVTVYLDREARGEEGYFWNFITWSSLNMCHPKAWNRDFLMLGADGALTAVFFDSPNPSELKKKLSEAVYHWCVEVPEIERPIVYYDTEGRLYRNIPYDNEPVVISVKIDTDAARIVSEMLLGKMPEGCEKYLPQQTSPWLLDSLKQMEMRMTAMDLDIRNEYSRRLKELERQLQMLKGECQQKLREAVKAEAARMKELFQKAEDSMGVKCCSAAEELYLKNFSW